MLAVIDARLAAARGLPTDLRLAGGPQLLRHLRLARRAGAQRVHVWANDRHQLERLRAVAGDAAGVTLGDEPPAEAAQITLPFHLVYTAAEVTAAVAAKREPVPCHELRTADDVGAAEAALIRAVRKPMSQDGVVAYYLQRPMTRPLTRALLTTPVTPNQVTVVALLVGVIGGVIAARGGTWGAALGISLVWLASALDCVDGDLARIRLQGSKLGEWLDTLTDDICGFTLLAGLGIGLARDTGSNFWLIAGPALAVVGQAIHVKIYLDLHRLGSVIDTAQYPWFFGKPSAEKAPSARPLAKLWTALGFGFRRDAYLTLVALLVFVGARDVATLVMAGGTAVVVVLFAAQMVIAPPIRRDAGRQAT